MLEITVSLCHHINKAGLVAPAPGFWSV